MQPMTRRQVLKIGLGTTLGLMASSCSTTGGEHWGSGEAHGKRTVIVIGAGLAGLTCARELLRRGFDVHVVEARDRVGGRVWSRRDVLDGGVVEAGGEFIDQGHQRMLALAREFSVDLEEATLGQGSATLGWVIDGKRLREYAAADVNAEVREGLSLLDSYAAVVDAHEPWKSPEAARLDATSLGDVIRGMKASAEAKAAMAAWAKARHRVDVNKQSVLAVLARIKAGRMDSYWFGTRLFRCKGGNDLLATKLAEALGKERVHLGVAALGLAAGSRGVMASLSNGQKVLAQDVVLAVPPAVWGKIRFAPALDESGPAFSSGAVAKYLAVVEKAYWKPNESWAMGDGAVVEAHGVAGRANAGVVVGLAAGDGAAACAAAPERDLFVQSNMQRLMPGLAKSCSGGRWVDWAAEEWTRGGAVFPAVGEVTRIGPKMRTAIAGLEHVHFAGDYLSLEYMGTMEGAVAAGETTAQALV